MLSLQEIETIERYLKGEADKKDTDFVKSLFTDGENNKSFIKYLKDDWGKTLIEGSSSDHNLDIVLGKIHRIIESEEKKRRKRKIRRAIIVYRKIAAVAFIPLFIAGIYFSRNTGKTKIGKEEAVTQIRINSPIGSRVAFTLPDSSNGMLNSGSSLAYSLPFDKNRHIELEGEAWFEVAHLENNPFEINTGSSIIRVLGTKFNVSSYPGDNFMEVVLDEGRVEVMDSLLKEKIIMVPDERLILQDGKSSITFVDPEKYIAWKEGELVFRGDFMPEVARRIERWYNVDLVVADEEINSYSFRGTFKDDSLEEVLRFLCLTSPISYKINHKDFSRDGLTGKTQVVISKNK
ncbi:MAG: DUF4974 domain-containing protein [Bacteroidales bacterium]|jgi:ferric-dicitrate binding protein FerR (iron transport regulator)|nr:DUF4974 domain-containing protein [Bacteroidales bacterium]